MKAILAHCPSAFVSGLTVFERHWLRSGNIGLLERVVLAA